MSKTIEGLLIGAIALIGIGVELVEKGQVYPGLATVVVGAGLVFLRGFIKQK